MKVNIGPLKGVRVRTQTRTVTKTDLIYRGQVIASGEAVLNPVDEFNEEVGVRKSVMRAIQKFKPNIAHFESIYGRKGPGIYSTTVLGLHHKVVARFKRKRERAQAFLDKFHRSFPTIKSMLDYLKPQLKTNNHLRTFYTQAKIRQIFGD